MALRKPKPGENIIEFLRDFDPRLDTPDLPERAMKMALDDPLFYALMWYFDAEFARARQKRVGAAGGEAASKNYEPRREAARKVFREKSKRLPKNRLLAEMQIASAGENSDAFSRNTILKIFEELAGKSKPKSK